MKLRDVFAGVASRFRSTFQPDYSFKTYRFSYPGEPIGVTAEFSNRIKYYIDSTVYAWAEANRIDDDKYTIRLIHETRHGYSYITDDNAREISAIAVGKKSIFSKAEVRGILERYENEFQKEGRSPDKNQPFRAQHYSRIKKPAVESLINESPQLPDRRPV